MLKMLTARAGALRECLCDTVLSNKGDTAVIVPKYLTLQTELQLVHAAPANGSFRINVLSVQRLADTIFETAGRTDLIRVDDKGRVMLVRRAFDAVSDRLSVYAGMKGRPGFPLRAAKQIEMFRQANVTPEALKELANGETGLAAHKLSDIALIMEEYEKLLAGRFTDGADELNSAAMRAKDSELVRSTSNFVFHGFDILSSAQMELVTALARESDVTVIFQCESDDRSASTRAFRPINSFIGRFRKRANASGVEVVTEEYAHSPVRSASLDRLYTGLFVPGAEPFAGKGDVRLFEAKNMRDEALFVAAECRRLAMDEGARFSEMLILCGDVNAYDQSLKKAFDSCSVPVFTSISRPTARYGLCEALLSALRLIRKNYDYEDALALLRSGLIDSDKKHQFAAYVKRYAPKGKALKQGFTYGDGFDDANVARSAVIEPVLAFADALKAASTLREQLAAVYGYVESIDAYDKLLERRRKFEEEGAYRLAGEISQVFNHLVDALDQMALLLGDRKLSLDDLADTLGEALSSSPVKALPQSGDAVYAQGVEDPVTQDVKYLFFMGMTDRGASDNGILLTDDQLAKASERSGIYFGEDADGRALMRRARVKNAAGAASQKVYFSYPLMSSDSGAESPSAVIVDLKRLFPDMETETSFETNAWAAALESMNGFDEPLLRSLSGRGVALASRLIKAREEKPQDLKSELTRRLYGDLKTVSITRLEKFSGCPFSHFVDYALRPSRSEPYVLDPLSEGNFLHDAMKVFLSRGGDPEERMDKITDELIDGLESAHLLDEKVSLSDTRRLRNAARVAAKTITCQLAQGTFTPAELELEFGHDGNDMLRLDTKTGPAVLEGRIDRIDVHGEGDDSFVRVIDYKRGNNTISLSGVYYGLQLQLVLYLAIALVRHGGAPAGTYYFHINEAILSNDSTDEDQITKERLKQLRLTGLTLNNKGVLEATGRSPETVVNVTMNKDGSARQGESVLDEESFSLVLERARKVAAQAVDRIRLGDARIAPKALKGRDPCMYCKSRNACLFDDMLDRSAKKTLPAYNNDEIIGLIKADAT